MKKIKIWNDNISDRQLDEICSYIENGSTIVAPTDTLYGLMCSALDSKAIERICRHKKINPEKTNLSIICNDISMAAEYSKIDNQNFRLIKDNTPGQFTFILRTGSRLPKAFKGRKTVGIRIPDNIIVRKISERLGHPLLSTSIEGDDYDSITNPDLIAENYESVADLIILGEDGGAESSTIIDCTGDEPEILREGAGKFE